VLGKVGMTPTDETVTNDDDTKSEGLFGDNMRDTRMDARSSASFQSGTTSYRESKDTPDKLWLKKLTAFKEFQASVLFQYPAERTGFVEEAELFFDNPEHGISAVKAGCFFYRVFYASMFVFLVTFFPNPFIS
jgi:hypothetical protein